MKKIIFDAHQDILTHEQDKNKKIIQTGFSDLIDSPVKLVVSSVFLEPDEIKNLNKIQQAKIIEKQIGKYLAIIEKNKKLLLIKNKKDLEMLMKSDLTGILIHIEGIDFIDENNLEVLDLFYKLGLRSVGLVWGKDNNIGAYSDGVGGLTEFGKKFIQKLNEKGIIIDLAHTNEKTFYDVLRVSQKPIMVSHGNSYALCENPRNFKDRQTKFLAEKQGVQGIFFSKKFVSNKDKVSIDDVTKHFEYVRKIAPNSIMIGSDFGGISSGFVENLNNIKQLVKVAELLEKKLGKKILEKIMYKNFFSFLQKIL